MKTDLQTHDVLRATGLTRKALRLYEARGLIRPAVDPANGYRRWSRDDLLRLQHIATLRTLGLSLAQIQRVLDGRPGASLATLDGQLGAVRRRIADLQRVEQALAALLEANPATVDLHTIAATTREIIMTQTPVQWFATVDEAALRASSHERVEPHQEDAIRAAWADLLARAAALQGCDADDPRLNPLADDWLALLRRFLGPNPARVRGLLEIYAHMDELPDERKLFDPALGRFIAPVLRRRLDAAGLAP